MRRVSEILREEREKKGYSFSDIQRETKIKREFLIAIEEGRFHALPSESYALGFVKNYASFLGLPAEKIAAFFRREYKEEGHEIVPRFRKHQGEFRRNRFFNVRSLLIAITIGIVLLYFYFQFSTVFFSPKLVIDNPRDGQTIAQSVVNVSGKTDQYATVTVDGVDVYVEFDGQFKKSLFVFSGTKKIEVIAKNRLGKQTKKTITVTVK